jgi:hypothetical protein
MLQQIAFGGAVSLVNIAIHAFAMTSVVMIAQSAFANRFHSSMLLVKVMVPTVLVLMITHVLEVIVWAFAYFVVGAAPVGCRSSVFCVRELHHFGVWRRRSRCALAAARPANGNERHAAVWMVNRGDI